MSELAAPRVLLGDGRFYVAYRPDADRPSGPHPELRELAESWVRANLTNNACDLPRYYALILNVKQVLGEGVPGDLAELGVYRGNSAAVLARLSRAHGRTLHLFDTFEGFDARDIVGIDGGKPIEFQDTSLRQVREIVGTEAVEYIPGYFPGSIPAALMARTFSVVHLDCDLHEPMKAGLEFFYPRLSPGGLLIIHDYGGGHWDGTRRAVDEFVSTIPERITLWPDKSGTAVIRKLGQTPGGGAGRAR